MRRSLWRRSRVPDGAEEKIDILERILLGRIDCGDFMDEKHCAYAKQVLSRKLESLREVWVSREYVVAVTEGRMNEEYYLIGRDSDSGLLFVNKVGEGGALELRRDHRIRLVAKSRSIRVYAVRDEDVKSALLGYDYDVIETPYIVDKPGAYRVQGDVVVQAQPIWQGEVVDAVARRVALIASKLAVADFVTAVLTERDIGVATFIPPMETVTPRSEGHTLMPVLSIPTTRGVASMLVGIASLLMEELSAYFGVGLAIEQRGENVAVVEPNQGGNAILILRPSGTIAEVAVDGAPTPLLTSTEGVVRDALLSYLYGRGAVDATLKVGRHHLTLRRVKSAVFAISTSQLVKLHYLEDRELTIRLADPPSYVVDENSEVVLRHAQHREKVLRFSGEYVISITHTRVAHDYTAEMNTVVLNNTLSDVIGAPSQASP